MKESLKGSANHLANDAIRPFSALAIAVAAISPTTSVFLVYGAGLAAAGTGVVWAFVIGGVIAAGMALSYAEVGSAFLSAGGAYTIVRRALGPIAGGVTALLFLVLGVVVTASILVAAATYLNSLIPALPVNWTAFLMMAIVTALSITKISPTSWVTTAMLMLELAVIIVFSVVAITHPAAHGASILHPVMAAGHGTLSKVGVSALLVAVVPALFAYNGYDWPLYFSEESTSPRRSLPKAVIVAAAISIGVELFAVIAATVATKNLGATTQSATPLSLIAQNLLGTAGADILLIGVVVAMFDTGLAGNLAYARIYYACARDGLLPKPLTRFFGYLTPKSKVPAMGFLVLFVGNGVLAIFTSLNNLITFTGVVIVVIYLLVAVSALVSRVRDKAIPRTFKMPLWPLPPIVAIIGVIIALSQQSKGDLITTAIVVLVGTAWFTLRRRSLPQRLDGNYQGEAEV